MSNFFFYKLSYTLLGIALTVIIKQLEGVVYFARLLNRDIERQVLPLQLE